MYPVSGVQVFGAGLYPHATLKTYHPATLVADGEHHLFPEAVVASRPWSVGDQHASVDQEFGDLRIAAKPL